ncbi:helix-turn-helix domain-containing protein [Streptomyces sp. NPDC059761]|uniref:helix-turn-helix domain-containing protein n=1 Tax=Streptomyces sp. NPDC059761 TaxID=3346937 RepID=UPI003666D9BD
MQQAQAPQKTLAQKLTTLINLKQRPDGTKYSKAEIAEAVSGLYAADRVSEERAKARARGCSEEQIAELLEVVEEKPLLTRPYFSQLCHGHRDNPTLTMLEYLARWFGVSPAYFFGGGSRTSETQAAEQEVELLAAVSRLVQGMQESGQADAPQLLTSLTRGLGGLSPDMVRGMIHMQLAAIDQANQGSGKESRD